MIQMDASSFDWLNNGSYLHLHGAVDDATGRILALHFEKEETLEGYCELIFQMNQDGHLPREIYTDGRTVYVYDSKKKKKLTLEEELAGKVEKQPNFARTLRELNILLIIAKSAQANEFLKQYIPYYNRKFAVQAANPEKAYLPMHDMSALQLIFAKHETRKLVPDTFTETAMLWSLWFPDRSVKSRSVDLLYSGLYNSHSHAYNKDIGR